MTWYIWTPPAQAAFHSLGMCGIRNISHLSVSKYIKKKILGAWSLSPSIFVCHAGCHFSPEPVTGIKIFQQSTIMTLSLGFTVHKTLDFRRQKCRGRVLLTIFSPHLKRDEDADPPQINAKPEVSFACSWQNVPIHSGLFSPAFKMLSSIPSQDFRDWIFSVLMHWYEDNTKRKLFRFSFFYSLWLPWGVVGRQTFVLVKRE